MLRKRISLLLMSIMAALGLSSCGDKDTLLFLNWGEYIDEELITAFEEEYNCKVIMDLGDSNEIFYSKVRGGTTVYDVVCPSDYMVEKMYDNDLLEKLDFSKLPNYDKSQRLPGVLSIFDDMNENMRSIDSSFDEDLADYAVPYLWGTWGIMYSTLKEGLPQAVAKAIEEGNEWAPLFDRTSIPANTRVAMYDSHQHAYFAACKHLGVEYGNREGLPENELAKVKDLIVDMKFDAWGTDNIKKDIVAGNIDVGFMWTGDFLYYYAENIADIVDAALAAGDVEVSGITDMIADLTGEEAVYTAPSGETYEIGFDLYIPEDTVAFCDNLVMTKDAMNKDLAYKFIDFMSCYELKSTTSTTYKNVGLMPAYGNAYYVCYNTPFANVFDDLVALSETDFNEVDEEDMYDAVYDAATGIAFSKYYKKDEAKGEILAYFDRHYINTINTTFNNARAE